MKKDIYKLYGFLSYFNYIWWLLVLNILICVANLPLIVVMLLIDFNLSSMPLFLFAGISLGPSLYAAFQVISELNDNERIIRCFINALREGTIKSLKVWIPFYVLLLVVLGDITILRTYDVFPCLQYFFILCFYIILTYIINYFIVWITWKGSIREMIILTGKLTIVKSVRCNLSFIIVLSTLFLMMYFPIYLLLYGFAIGLFLAYKNFVPIIEYVNKKSENQR